MFTTKKRSRDLFLPLLLQNPPPKKNITIDGQPPERRRSAPRPSGKKKKKLHVQCYSENPPPGGCPPCHAMLCFLVKCCHVKKEKKTGKNPLDI